MNAWEPYRKIQPEDGINTRRPCQTADENGVCRRKREYVSWHRGHKICVAVCAIHAGMTEK